MHDPLGCQTCPVRDIAVCAGLDDAERTALARLGQRRQFARGETVFSAGDDAVACATLISGAIKLSKIDAEGIERTVAIVHPAGFLARLFAATGDCAATALVDSELCLFPAQLIEREMRTYPSMMERVLKATLEQLEESRALIDLIGRRDSRARVAGLLLLFLEGVCDAEPRGGGRIEMPLNRGEMASLLGLTIETVSRQLSRLEAEGVLRRDGLRFIDIPDIGLLRRTAA